MERLEPHVHPIGEDEMRARCSRSPYADESVLLSWVVGLGTSGELLEPSRLRERIRTALGDVARSHEGPGRDSTAALSDKRPAPSS